MDRQRIYDAMLIKAFRSDISLNYLFYWLKPYNIVLPAKDLIRQPPPIPMMVRVFVGIYLKPLADKLWDTDPSEDIKTLDWMKNLRCEQTDRAYEAERRKLKRQNKADRQRSGLLHQDAERHKQSNQWHVTKPKLKIGRIK